GWLARSGYSGDELSAFLVDLSALAARLCLIPVAIEPGNPACLDLQKVSALARFPAGSGGLNRLHLRIYAPADYLARWNRVFGWQEDVLDRRVVTDPALVVMSAIESKTVSQRQLAKGMGVDASLLNKVLRGKKPWPAGWLDRATRWLASHNSG